MEITVQLGVIAALVLALASIAGGVVLFRGSRRVGWRALGTSAVAGGVGVLVVFALLLTVSSEGQAPEPIIVGKVVSTQPTDAPTPPKDIPLTTVITMAKANEIREIHVDGKKLTVYPKTIARGGADSFVSRIGDDTDIIGLLIDSGVEVGLLSGVVVTFKGVSAEDVQAAISAALAQAATPIGILVTPTPGPALTPTPTAKAAPTTTPLPQRPLIRLRHDGQVYSGVAGNSCWPVETGVSVCGVEGPLPWEIVDVATGESCPSGASWCGTAVPVAMGDRIIVEIDADDQPKGLQVAIYGNDSQANSDPPEQVIKLETGFTETFAIDVPAGIYYIRISGQWDDGDIAYKFKMTVTS